MSSHLISSLNKNAIATRPKPKPERLADLEYEAWRRDMIYRIYGNQNPPTETHRGRASHG